VEAALAAAGDLAVAVSAAGKDHPTGMNRFMQENQQT
jgi:hypothetical protein